MFGLSLTSTVDRLRSDLDKERRDCAERVQQKDETIAAKNALIVEKSTAISRHLQEIDRLSGDLAKAKMDTDTTQSALNASESLAKKLSKELDDVQKENHTLSLEVRGLRSLQYFTDEYRRCLSAIFSDDKTPIFISGPAGTGKSNLIRIARDLFMSAHPSRALQVVAPTGIAAENIQGVTIHSFFKFNPDKFCPTTGYDLQDSTHKPQTELIKRTDILIVDEASMVKPDIVDAIDTSLRYLMGKPTVLFGGTKVVFIGDLGQLPPVHDRVFYDLNRTRYGSPTPYFFSAKALSSCWTGEPHYIHRLTTIFRQIERKFIDALLQVRFGPSALSVQSSQLLSSCYTQSPPPENRRTTLCAINKQADQINADALRMLDGQEVCYEMSTTGNVSQQQKQDSRYPISLHLKEGARVMLLENNLPNFSNGTVGIVAALSPDAINVRTSDGRIVTVVRSTVDIRQNRIRIDGNVETVTIGTITQFPMKLAWGITIHKSQGQTLDEVYVDLSRAFGPGMVYTALSRVRTLSGLKLLAPFDPGKIQVDPLVKDWL